MELSRFPSEIRLKLDKETEKELWREIEKEGIANYSKKFEYSSSQFYNWKNKDVFLPVNVVRKTLSDHENLCDKINGYKGPGRSKTIENPVIPLPKNNEILTRINASVTLSEGTPIYQVKDQGLIDRFIHLLQKYGDVPYQVYNRSTVYELRYPKFLHKLFQRMDYDKDFAALVDEQGEIDKEAIKLNQKEKDINDFKGDLYSRNKALKLALAKEDNQKVKEIMAKEAEKVKQTFNR